MRTLEAARGRGRDDYPVRAMWNSVLAGIVFQHPSIESLRRELSRNAQLRVLCGFAGPHAPPASAYTRFLRRVMDQLPMIAALFDRLVDALQDLLPDFGERLAIDSKAIPSWASRPPKNPTPDGRRDWLGCRLWQKGLSRTTRRRLHLVQSHAVVWLQTPSDR